jgi:hypothetical protein
MAPNPIIGGDGGQTLSGTGGADLIYGFDPNGAAANPSGISAMRVASGLSQPLFVTAAPDDPSRIFVVEKTGLIRIVDLSGEEAGIFQVKATPFLDLTTQISAAGEGGLLGLVFDPNYAQNGLFYVNLINTAGDTEIRRYQVSGNPDVANAASAQLVITVDQPSATNHKAGWLGFGPDGLLYAALGDGGSDASTSQDVNNLLGKILRLNVHGDDFPADATRNYAIPAGNPLAGRRRAPTRSGPWACAIPGATVSTARPANCSSPTSAPGSGRKSISAQSARITAGRWRRARPDRRTRA